jgi:hypothetical protein
VSKAKPSSQPLATAMRTSRPITRNTASCVPLQVRVGIPVTSFRTGALTRAVVQPALGPASSLMEMRGAMFGALSRVSPLFIIYHSHTADCRGLGGDKSRPEQPQLNPTFATTYGTSNAQRIDSRSAQDAINSTGLQSQ